MARQFDRVSVWDMGPEQPVAPPLPAAPEGMSERAQEEFLFRLHMIRAASLIAKYDNDHARYLDDMRMFNAFGGKPRQISVFSNEAKEMKARDPRRYRDTPV